MTVSVKHKANDNEIDQSKTGYNLDKQTAKILNLWTKNVAKYEFVTGEDI